MIIYNVTIKVEHDIHEQWVHWMKTKHIPEVMATNCFIKNTFLRILDIDETDGVTYAIQYFATDKTHYNRYITVYANDLRAEGNYLWGNKFMAFRSLMQVVN